MSKELAKSTVLNAVASIAIIVGGFFTTVIVARLLGPEAVGVVAYAAFIITLSIAILDIGIPGALMRFLPELEADGQDRQAGALIRFYFVPYLIASALYAAGLILLLDPASFSADGAYSGKLLVWLIAGAVLTQSLASFYYGALRGRMQFLSFAKFTLISALLQLATAWVGSRLFGISGAMAAPITGFLLAAIVAFRSLAYPGAVGRALNLRVANFAWRTWGSFVLTTLAWSRMEIYFLKHSWGDHAAGLFAAGLNLANLALQLPLLLTGALLPFLVLKMQGAKHRGVCPKLQHHIAVFRDAGFPGLPRRRSHYPGAAAGDFRTVIYRCHHADDCFDHGVHHDDVHHHRGEIYARGGKDRHPAVVCGARSNPVDHFRPDADAALRHAGRSGRTGDGSSDRRRCNADLRASAGLADALCGARGDLYGISGGSCCCGGHRSRGA